MISEYAFDLLSSSSDTYVIFILLFQVFNSFMWLNWQFLFYTPLLDAMTDNYYLKIIWEYKSQF